MAQRRKKMPSCAGRAGVIERADASIGMAAARYRDSPAMKVVKTMAEVADQPPLITISAATILAGFALGAPRLTRVGWRMLAAELVATGIKAAIKRNVARTRPRKALKDGRYAARRDDDGQRNEGPWNSFPSGHTAGIVAVSRAIAREFPRTAPAMTGIAAAVAVAQPFIGAHFPLDVIGGAGVGFASEALVEVGSRFHSRAQDAPLV